MFRKTKRKAKASLRRKDDDEEEETKTNVEESTSDLLVEARKRVKTTSGAAAASTSSSKKDAAVMHSYNDNDKKQQSHSDMATSTAEHHPTEKKEEATAEKGADGIFRNTHRNKFLAGPIRAAQNVRVTARFDYQPDICKDYKDTGFCGFGDTCIYLHDRGDTMTGWQLEQQWEEERKAKQQKQQAEMEAFVKQHTGGGGKKEDDGTLEALTSTDDGLPFACHLCREHFKQPVVTHCQHYFCQSCILDHVQQVSDACPICQKDTSGVFNQPTKLISKLRRVLGAKKAKSDTAWLDYYKQCTQGSGGVGGAGAAKDG